MSVSHEIERDSPVPYYEQLFGILRTQILDGLFPSDDRLPSELELCREYGLSRATVRQTLAKLETEGFARRVVRRGFFATVPKPSSGWVVQDTQGFLDSQLHQGRTGITTRVVSGEFVSPDPHVAEALQIQRSDRVFALERVRSLDGRIALFSTNWFPGEVGQMVSESSDVLDGTGSVDSTLRRSGFVTDGAYRVIRAMHAPAPVAAHLRVGPQEPVLQVRSWSWDKDGRRFDYYETWVLTDVVPLEVLVAAN
jgi:GntR family transcriptional regulator